MASIPSNPTTLRSSGTRSPAFVAARITRSRAGRPGRSPRSGEGAGPVRWRRRVHLLDQVRAGLDHTRPGRVRRSAAANRSGTARGGAGQAPALAGRLGLAVNGSDTGHRSCPRATRWPAACRVPPVVDVHDRDVGWRDLRPPPARRGPAPAGQRRTHRRNRRRPGRPAEAVSRRAVGGAAESPGSNSSAEPSAVSSSDMPSSSATATGSRTRQQPVADRRQPPRAAVARERASGPIRTRGAARAPRRVLRHRPGTAEATRRWTGALPRRPRPPGSRRAPPLLPSSTVTVKPDQQTVWASHVRERVGPLPVPSVPRIPNRFGRSVRAGGVVPPHQPLLGSHATSPSQRLICAPHRSGERLHPQQPGGRPVRPDPGSGRQADAGSSNRCSSSARSARSPRCPWPTWW